MVKCYRILSVKQKIFVAVFILGILLTSIYLVAGAAIDPSSVFTSQSPADGEKVYQERPTVSVVVYNIGSVNINSAVMSLDGVPVNPVLTGTNPQFTLTYTPVSNLSAGVHTVIVSIAVGSERVVKSWSFTVGLGPGLTNYIPASGAAVNQSSFQVSCSVADPDKINAASAVIKVNGKSVPTSVNFQQIGHWEKQWDPEEAVYYDAWVIDGYDYTKATIYGNVTNAPDQNTVQVTLADQLGFASSAEWSFRTTVPPVITSQTPLNGAIVNTGMPTISAKITDNGTVDPGSIILKVGASVVQHSFNQSTGIVTYTPTVPLPAGTCNVYLEAKDTSGNWKSATWSFTIRQGTATFSSAVPASGTEVAVFNPDISIKVSDTNNLDRKTVSMVINGVKVPPTFNHVEIGHMVKQLDPCTGEYYDVWIVDGYDYTKGTFTYKPATLPDGKNNLAVSIADTSGRSSSYSWSFNVKAPPVISSVTPADSSYVKTQTPLISAKISDNGTIAQINMSVDGTAVYASLDQSSGTVTYTPPVGLTNGIDHTVKLNVTDGVGATASFTWKFKVQTYDVMPVDNNCTTCHQGYPAPKHPMTNCDGCHGGGRPVEDCRECHDITIHSPDRLNVSYLTCNSCHNSTYSNKIPVHPADIDSFHITTTQFEKCNSCHTMFLTQEHFSHKDSTGSNYTCYTCHTSINPRVQMAIANKTKNCDACHDMPRHDFVHATTVLDDKCTTCHQNSLTGEHLDNKITQTQTWSCETCHANTKPAVIGAIANENKPCAACHSEGHNIKFAETVPADIPLYDKYAWSIPQDARIWTGEDWLAEEFLTGGKVLISNRRNDVTGDAVWTYYNKGLTSAGWTIASPAPAAGSNYFSVTFTKGVHKLIIRFYGGADGAAAPVVPGGYRTEILYR